MVLCLEMIVKFYDLDNSSFCRAQDHLHEQRGPKLSRKIFLDCLQILIGRIGVNILLAPKGNSESWN